MAEDHPERSTEAFFGRRRGKRLRPQQNEALNTALSQLKIDLTSRPPARLEELFPAAVKDVRLEIGFGGGEHLLNQVSRYPDTGFIGVEPFVNGMAKLASAIEGKLPQTLRLYDDDATQLLDWLPENAISGIDLLYPDPWPKKKHWKRRFVSAVNLDRFARVMKPGARFRFASDIDTYVNWTLQHCRRHEAFEWQAQSAEDWHTPYEGWPARAMKRRRSEKAGRRPISLSCESRNGLGSSSVPPALEPKPAA